MTGALARYGEAVMAARRAGSPVTDPGFGWDWMSPVILAMNGPQRDQVIQELYDAVLTAADRPMATVGAYKLLCEWDGDQRDERFLALRDAYTDLMRQQGYSSAHLTGYETERWVELHGDLGSTFDRRG